MRSRKPGSLLATTSVALAALLAACGGASGQANPGRDATGPGPEATAAGNEASARDAGRSTADAGPLSPVWVSAYYAAWEEYTLPPTAIDYTAVTDVILFAAGVNADGTINTSVNGMTAAHISAAVSAAHAAGRKITVSLGGAGSGASFSSAIMPATLPTFVSNIMMFLASNQFDGVDIDMEPVNTADDANFVALAATLRTKLDALGPGHLLTTAAAGDPTPFVMAQASFDEVNVMTYDMSGPWSTATWYNSPLYDNGSGMPSIQADVAKWIKAGMKPAKLGIGIEFLGGVWHGAYGPDQPLSTVTKIGLDDPYTAIMSTYGATATYHFDTAVGVPYLSIGTAPGTGSVFISFDDPMAIQLKLDFVRKQGLGGAILFELSSGYDPSAPAGSRDVLLQAVKKAAFGG